MSMIGHNSAKKSSKELTNLEKDALKNCIVNVNDAMTRIESERELIKNAISDLCDAVLLDKKIVRKIARVYHGSGFAAENEEFLTFEEFYKLLFPDRA